MFRGQHINRLDSKGRVNIPAKYRDFIMEEYNDGTLFITKMITKTNNSLVVYPSAEWRSLEERLRGNVSEFGNEYNSFMDVFYSSAKECPLDKQGRVLIPPELREHAKLEKDILFIGDIFKRFFIWNPELWEKRFQNSVNTFDESLDAIKNKLAK